MEHEYERDYDIEIKDAKLERDEFVHDRSTCEAYCGDGCEQKKALTTSEREVRCPRADCGETVAVAAMQEHMETAHER